MLKSILVLLLLLSCPVLGSAAEKFDWSKILVVPPGATNTKGNQILHFKPDNKPYWDDPQAQYFVEKYLVDAKALTSDAEVLRYGSDHVTLQGLFIELGACTGKTINFIAALNPHQKIYGFDSFEGLPEDWVRKDKTITAGTYGFKNPDVLPPVLHNVDLIKGWFDATLKDFVKAHDLEGPIAFLHVDCDIYSSTATAFRILGSKIRPGTIIVFDEFYNYPGFENHEYKAFLEFLAQSGFEAHYLAYNIYHEQVALRIIEKPRTISKKHR